MTNEEKVTLDIERASEFLRYLIDNPSEMEKIPNGCHMNVRKVYEFA
ncbi:MAG: hypothetical protein FWH22_10345 [Fibromonadales bacterium]|nr:hypothetical protein [Fibromonadales bacterium]